MKQLIFNLLMMLVLASCSMNSVSYDMPIDSETYQKDKQQICDTYVNNIEYYRLHHLYNIDTIDYKRHYENYPKAQDDPANFYSPYGCRVTKNGSKFVPSEYPTNTQLNIGVDTIIYDNTGNLFIAFIYIEKNFSDNPSLRDIKHGFDGRAMIGYRDTVNGILKIYPLTNFIAISLKDKQEALRSIKRDYMNNLKGTYLSGSVYGSNEFDENVGDNSFFRESRFFKKNGSNLYLFQLYKDLDGVKEYKYPFGT